MSHSASASISAESDRVQSRKWSSDTRSTTRSASIADMGCGTAATSAYLDWPAAPRFSDARATIRARLKSLINDFYINGYLSCASDPVKVDRQTSEASRLFLDLLPADKNLPTVIPDGEGGLVMHWDRLQNPALLVVDGWRLHGVAFAGTDHAEYLAPVTLMPSHIPSSILAII